MSYQRTASPPAPTPTPAAHLACAITSQRYRYADEDQLQAGLSLALEAQGIAVQREVRLNRRDRIDLLVGRVGIEVKIDSAPATVLRQLRRYAESPLIDELILVTTKARHSLLPREVGDKRLIVCSLSGGGL